MRNTTKISYTPHLTGFPNEPVIKQDFPTPNFHATITPVALKARLLRLKGVDECKLPEGTDFYKKPLFPLFTELKSVPLDRTAVPVGEKLGVGFHSLKMSPAKKILAMRAARLGRIRVN